jgi:hypothetical protein
MHTAPIEFNDLAPGTYAVTFTPRDDFVFTAWNVDGQGVEGVRNSDADPITGEAAPLTLVSGQIVDYVDAGLYVPPSIGRFVWDDLNGNGLQDNDEPGIPGVTVTLTGTDGLGSQVSLTTTTNDNGAYLFDNLVPGTYTVAFTAPAGYVFTAQDADGQGITGTANSDANPATGAVETLTLVSGAIATFVDAGLYVPPSIGGFVWEDTNGNGLQDGGEPGIPGRGSDADRGGRFGKPGVADDDHGSGRYLSVREPGPGHLHGDVHRTHRPCIHGAGCRWPGDHGHRELGCGPGHGRGGTSRVDLRRGGD